MSMEKKIDCFVCDRQLSNWEYNDVEVHPMDGLQFRTYGHYGSTVFDPMNGSYLDIAICDRCVMLRYEKVRGSGYKDFENTVNILFDALDRHG